MAVAASLRTSDPPRSSVRKGAAAVERRRDLEAHPRPPARHARNEADVEPARLGLHQAVLEADARALERAAAFEDLRFGSRMAATTRLTLQSTNLVTHGGVRP